MKRPLVGSFLGRFYFYVHTIQTIYQGLYIVRVFGQTVHEKKIF